MILLEGRLGSPIFIVNTEVRLPMNALSKLKYLLMACKEIATVVLAKVQDVVKAIEKKSIQRGEIVWKKLPQCDVFHGSRSISQLGEIFN